MQLVLQTVKNVRTMLLVQLACLNTTTTPQQSNAQVAHPCQIVQTVHLMENARNVWAIHFSSRTGNAPLAQRPKITAKLAILKTTASAVCLSTTLK